MLQKICVLFFLFLSSAGCLLAQSQHAATSATSITVGAEFSTFNPDWGCNSSSPLSCWGSHVVGLGAVVDVNNVLGRIGVEGEMRWQRWGGPPDKPKQSNYLIGPRYRLYRFRNLSLLAKIPVGVSRMSSNSFASGTYFTLAPGGTVSYRLTNKVAVRADYEYQIWPGFSGRAGFRNNGLTPNGFSFGGTYQLLR